MNPPPFSVILNPTSGARRGERFLEEVRALVQSRGGVLRVTERAGQATDLARKDQQAGITLVFAGGGDDTVREVIHGIFGSDCRLGILPLGTFNNLASSLLLPHHPLEALLGALDGQDDHIDLGQVDGGPIFTESVGVGIDSEAWSLAPEQEPVGIWRWLTGIRLGLTTLSTFNPQHLRITVRLQDGLLDVCLIPLMNKLQLLASLPLFFSGRHLDRIPDVIYHQGREIEISARRDTPVRVDGVIGGRLPIRIRVLPRALGIRLPHRADSSQDPRTI